MHKDEFNGQSLRFVCSNSPKVVPASFLEAGG